MAKPKMGRPSKYKPEFCQMLIEHMAKGFSFESFAGLIEVQGQTIYNWLESEPEFLEAKNAAFDKSRLFWERIGIEFLVNKYQGDNLNTTLWIFNMKNRFGWRDVKEEKESDQKPLASVYKLHDRSKPKPAAG